MYHNKKETHESISHISRLEGSGYRRKAARVIRGIPGIGKSAVIHQLAAELAIPLRDIRALLLDLVDLRGLSFLGSDGRSKWATPDFLPQDGEGILFLDELNAAPALVQASCYQPVLDRKLGEYTLPEGWVIAGIAVFRPHPGEFPRGSEAKEEPLERVHLALNGRNRISLSLDQISVGVEVFSPLLGPGIYRREMLFFHPATMVSGNVAGLCRICDKG